MEYMHDATKLYRSEEVTYFKSFDTLDLRELLPATHRLPATAASFCGCCVTASYGMLALPMRNARAC